MGRMHIEAHWYSRQDTRTDDKPTRTTIVAAQIMTECPGEIC